MKARPKLRYIPLIVILFIFTLYTDYAYSAGTPVVYSGTDQAAVLLGEVDYREFSSGVNEEVFLGVPDLGLGGAHRTEMNLTWSPTNTITFSYDPLLDKLTTTVDNSSDTWSLEYTQFSNNVRDLVYAGDQAAADNALSHLNYLQINVTLREKPSALLSLDNTQLDGIPLGNFAGVYHGTESWYVSGYDFSSGFSFTGELNFSDIFNPSPDKNSIEIFLGSVEVEEPVVSNVLAVPDKAAPGETINLTATAADSGTNNIQSAEFNVDGGPWSSMDPQDGTYNSPTENVVVDFSAPTDQGPHNVCVRAKNTLNNTGQEECTELTVDGLGPAASNLQVVPNAVQTGDQVTFTATMDDSATGGTNIQSAQYRLGGGSWQPMNPQDGSFNSPSEVVEATFAVSNPPGDYALCTRGEDALGNLGDESCTQLLVSEMPTEPSEPGGPSEIFLPMILNLTD